MPSSYVNKQCACGAIYPVRINMFNRSVRCPACQAEYVREYGRTYVIICDPCQGWGSHTALSFNVIVGLVKARYLEPGTVFRNHLWEIEIKKDWTIERRRLK